jgi:hypothetical protein
MALSGLAPNPLDAEDMRILQQGYRVSVDPKTGDLDFVLNKDATDRELRDALKVIRKIKRHQQPEDSKFETGELWIWDAHRKNDPEYLNDPDLKRPGLGLTFDVIAGNQVSRNHRAADPRVPPHVRKYLDQRSKKPEARKQIAIRAYRKVEKYRHRLEAAQKGYWFRFNWLIMMAPETIEKFLRSKSPTH